MRRLGSYCAALAAVAVTPALRAQQAPQIDVRVEACSLNAEQLERLVRLELRTVLVATAGLRHEVSIRCEPDAVQLRIFDPVTNKSLERTVTPPPASAPEPERIVALGIAQLYRAAWLELVADDPPPLPAREPPPPAAAIEAAKSVVTQKLSAAPQARLVSLVSLVARGGAAVRAIGASPVVVASMEVAGAWRPRSVWWLSAGATFEAGSVTRSTGSVAVRGLGGWIGLGVEPLRYGAFSGFLEVDAGVARFSMEGSQVAAGFLADAVTGAAFDGSVKLGAALRIGAVRFELLARAGALLGAPRGRVAGDQPVTINGIAAGAAAGVGFHL